MISVNVPAESRVFINGMATTSTGTSRRYISRGLEPGMNYAYQVRVELDRDGETLVDTQSVELTAGDARNLEFAFAEQAGDEQIASTDQRTTLVVHVPENAKVFLAGQETRSTGPVREFATTALANGQNWAEYPIVVKVDLDGQTLTEERTVTLEAGQAKEITFDFDTDAKVASR